MNRTLIIQHYKKFHNLGELTEDCQIDIDWAEALITDSCNALPLQENRKKCSACGQMFTAKNKQQEFCSGKCRVRLHRANTQLQKFNQKVKEILRNEKFIIEQIITSEGKCPFVVYYNGEKFQSDSTKSLLAQIKRRNEPIYRK